MWPWRNRSDTMREQLHALDVRIATLEAENRMLRMVNRVLDRLAPAPLSPALPAHDPLGRLNDDPELDTSIEDAIAQRAGPAEHSLRNNLIALANRRLRSGIEAGEIAREILEGAVMSEDEQRFMELEY